MMGKCKIDKKTNEILSAEKARQAIIDTSLRIDNLETQFNYMFKELQKRRIFVVPGPMFVLICLLSFITGFISAIIFLCEKNDTAFSVFLSSTSLFIGCFTGYCMSEDH